MDRSIIGRLPAELRNRIYDLLLAPPATLEVRVYRGAPKINYGQVHNDIFALAQTCKAIANEALSTFYGYHKFVIIVQPFYYDSNDCIMIEMPRPVWTQELYAFMNSINAIDRKRFRFVTLELRGKLHLGGLAVGQRPDLLAQPFRHTLLAVKSELFIDLVLALSLQVCGSRYPILELLSLSLHDDEGNQASLDRFTSAMHSRFWRDYFTAALGSQAHHTTI